MDEADAAHTKLSSVMKPRDHMATCKLSDKLSEAFEIMLQEKQNMVLVMDSDAHPGSQVHGVITTADALRCFSEIVHIDRITVETLILFAASLAVDLTSFCLPHFYNQALPYQNKLLLPYQQKQRQTGLQL